MAGVTSYGAYIPLYRLNRAEIARAWGVAETPGEKAVANYDEDSLTMAARSRDKSEAWTLDRVYSLFPILEARANIYGNLLSGGEQQMLSIGRALMTNPDLLLLDESSEGLAPLITQEISRVIKQLKGSLSVLLAEQNLPMALNLADYVYVISKVTVVYQSTPQELRDNEEIKGKHLGV